MKIRRLLLLIVPVILLMLAGCSSAEESNIYSGFVEGSPYKLSAEFGGLVTRVYVEDGNQVAERQLLVEFDKSDLEFVLQQAREGLSAAEGALAALDDKPQQAGIDAAFADIEKAEAQREQITYYEELLVTNIISEADFAMLFGTTKPEDALELADGAISLAKTAWVQAIARPAEEETAIAQAAIDQANAAIDLILAQIRHVDIIAVNPGVITQVLTNTGAVAAPGQTLIELIDPQNLSIVIYVPAARISEISLGAEVSIKIDSYPEDTFTGEIIRIADEAQFTPSNVQTKEERVKLVFAVEIQVLDGFDKIKPGIPADVIFE